jgi:actin-related protein 5
LQEKLQAEGFNNDAALDDTIKRLEGDLKRARKKEADGNGDEAESVVSPEVSIWRPRTH